MAAWRSGTHTHNSSHNFDCATPARWAFGLGRAESQALGSSHILRVGAFLCENGAPGPSSGPTGPPQSTCECATSSATDRGVEVHPPTPRGQPLSAMCKRGPSTTTERYAHVQEQELSRPIRPNAIQRQCVLALVQQVPIWLCAVAGANLVEDIRCDI